MSLAFPKSLALENPNTLGYCCEMKCSIHKVPLVCYCPVCRGSAKTKRKAAASRENGRLGGRPKGSKDKRKRKTANQGRR